jgi:hypothetical protein
MTTRTQTWLSVIAVLGLTFWLYAKLDVVIMLSEQLWSCF